MFDDDPLATPAYRQPNSAVMFGTVVKRADGAQGTSYTFKLKPRGEF